MFTINGAKPIESIAQIIFLSNEKALLRKWIKLLLEQKCEKVIKKATEDGNRIVRIQVGKCEGEGEYPNALVNIRVKDRDRMAVFFAEIRHLSYVRFVEEL
jgi:putative lipoic acid-binding regulatory protein